MLQTHVATLQPLNEMYAMLIPSLLMGNVAVLKLPAIGGLVHLLTARAFAQHLPPGVINFVSGSGRQTMGPIMETGLVDVLGFIGGVKGAVCARVLCRLHVWRPCGARAPSSIHAIIHVLTRHHPCTHTRLRNCCAAMQDALIKAQPSPHRLKVFAQLEGKNLGIVRL